MDISVIVTSYNHEKYITHCLESILNQKGNFQMEVIIGDDASTDNTQRIVEQYLSPHPGIVILLPSEENLGITKNLKRCLEACTGEYIAICEGDDYWTDVYKLQKQKDFLDQHRDCSMCFSLFLISFEETGTFELYDEPLYLNRDFLSTEDLIERNSIGNFSCCMYRREAVRLLPERLFELYTVDWMFNMACGQLGRIGLIRDPMSVYRKHRQGAWAGGDRLENLEKLLHLIDRYNEYFDYKYNTLFTKKKEQLHAGIARLRANHADESADIRKLSEWNQSLVIRLAEAERSLQSGPGNRPFLARLAGRLQRLLRFTRRPH